LIETHLLKPLGPKESLTLAIQDGGRGDPTGYPPGALNCFPNQGFHHLSIGRRQGTPGLSQGQVIHLPAGAPPVQPSGHDQPKGLRGLGRQTKECQMHHWGLGEGRHHGSQKTLRQPQQKGALKLGEEGEKSRVLEQV
jgi:hypothetical protein